MTNLSTQGMFARIRVAIASHKFISGIAALVVVWAGYSAYGKFTGISSETKYVTAIVEKGTIIASINGSGQVSALNQIDIKPKVSGEVTSVEVQNGQAVATGARIAELDTRDAQKTVRDAEANLESAKLALQKLTQPADELSITQSKNALALAQESKQNAEANLKSGYDDGFNDVTNAFLDLPGVMTGLHDMLFNTSASLGGVNVQNIDFYKSTAGLYDDRAEGYRLDAYNKYMTALAKYNQNFQDYKAIDRTGNPTIIESMVNETYDTAKALADAVKSANNLIQFYEDQSTQHNVKYLPYADTQLATLNTFTGKTNTHLSVLSGVQNTIKSNKDAIIDTGRSIIENTQALAKLKAGADALDIASAQLTVKQRENALLDARQNLDDYYINAPFSGVIAVVNVKNTDSVTSGTVVATLITKQKIAEIALNEVDAAKIKVKDKATLTFDAIDGLTLTGEVAQIDTVGTVTQGVVTYDVKISFDTQDERVKPGMSVSAAIITQIKQDVLTVENSAVKSKGSSHYVEVFDTPISGVESGQGVPSVVLPRQQTVEIGLSNDTQTEIVSGLKEGDQVVVRIIAPSTATVAKAPSLFGGGGPRPGGVRL